MFQKQRLSSSKLNTNLVIQNRDLRNAGKGSMEQIMWDI